LTWLRHNEKGLPKASRKTPFFVAFFLSAKVLANGSRTNHFGGTMTGVTIRGADEYLRH
jgi:hypothetical protein